MTGQAAEEAADGSAQRQPFLGERQLFEARVQLDHGKTNYQDPDDDLDHRNLESSLADVIGCDRRQFRKIGQQPRADESRNDAGQGEFQQDLLIGFPSHKRQLKDIVRQMDDRRHGYSRFQREKEREYRHQQVA